MTKLRRKQLEKTLRKCRLIVFDNPKAENVITSIKVRLCESWMNERKSLSPNYQI